MLLLLVLSSPSCSAPFSRASSCVAAGVATCAAVIFALLRVVRVDIVACVDGGVGRSPAAAGGALRFFAGDGSGDGDMIEVRCADSAAIILCPPIMAVLGCDGVFAVVVVGSTCCSTLLMAKREVTRLAPQVSPKQERICAWGVPTHHQRPMQKFGPAEY